MANEVYYVYERQYVGANAAQKHNAALYVVYVTRQRHGLGTYNDYRTSLIGKCETESAAVRVAKQAAVDESTGANKGWREAPAYLIEESGWEEGYLAGRYDTVPDGHEDAGLDYETVAEQTAGYDSLDAVLEAAADETGVLLTPSQYARCVVAAYVDATRFSEAAPSFLRWLLFTGVPDKIAREICKAA